MCSGCMCSLAVCWLPRGLSRVFQQYTMSQQNTKYRLRGTPHQADIYCVRTAHGDIIAIFGSGI